ncbi:MATE family efflux transporter [Pseudaestuariivita atlantica]|uniref:Multidrug transporter MATE n=1 Tax=Pseudaestuariivita atlantica TaxID=1317121 RepID=A0A0L1JQ30_9RHOB|nr:MATE family efflux transporter [Pseudaestuariivita atlantica]KNG93875.1 multidrug transporter MATE [Pseudaestuariivita atlantica]
MRDVDLTQGPIAGHFRTLAVPAAMGMLFSTLYNVVDVFFAGQISTDAQAGLAIGFQAFFIMMAVGFGIGAAMGALVGNARGKKDDPTTRRTAMQGLSFAVVTCGLLIVLGAFCGPLLIQLVSEPGAYRDAATGYFYWLLAALPGFLIAYAGNGILQAHGDSVTMQRAMMAAFVANIGLNPLFIYGIPGVIPGIGFNGIALSTIVSQTGVMLFVLRAVLRLRVIEDARPAELRPDLASYREIAVQMAPTSASFVVLFVSGFVVQYALSRFGGHAIAAYGIALRIEQILLLPVLGMTGALLPIAAQNFGAAQPDRVRAALWFCWRVGGLITLVAAPILWFGGGLFMRLFTDDPAVIAVGHSYLKIDSVLFGIYMMLFSINSLLQAFKRPIWTLWISIYRQGFGVAFFIWLLIGVLGMDVWGVFLGIGIAVGTGWLLSLWIAIRISREEIGGLRG